MARSAIDKNEVFSVIDQIAADKKKTPTVSEVREHIGSGSFSTLGPIVAEWREKMQIEAKTQVPDLPNAATDAFQRVWVLVWSEAQKCLDGERKALDDNRKAIENENAKLLSEYEKIESDNSRFSVQLEVQDKKLKDADDKIIGLQNDNARLKSENDLLQKTIEREQNRSDKLQSQLLEIASKAAQPKPQARTTRRKSKANTTSEQVGV